MVRGMVVADSTVAVGVAGALLFLIIVAVLIAIALAVQIYIIRAGLDPVRQQLQRIADELEDRTDIELAGDDDD